MANTYEVEARPCDYCGHQHPWARLRGQDKWREAFGYPSSQEERACQEARLDWLRTGPEKRLA